MSYRQELQVVNVAAEGLYLADDDAGLAPAPPTTHTHPMPGAATRGAETKQQMAVFLCLFLNSSQFNKYYYVQ